MADIESMAEAKTGDNLAEEPYCFLLRQGAVFKDITKQITTLDILKDKIPSTTLACEQSQIQLFLFHVQLSSVLPDIVETNNIGMLD